MTALSVPSMRLIQRLLAVLVIANTVVFLSLALSGHISNAPDTIVFVDFWGRLTVYSFWFLTYALYVKIGSVLLRNLIAAGVLLNIPLFLLCGYLKVLPQDPVNAVMIDFWGRLTVYSLWFIGYEAYRRHIGEPLNASKLVERT